MTNLICSLCSHSPFCIIGSKDIGLLVYAVYGGGNVVKIRVSLECDVIDLTEAILAKLPSALKNYDASQIDLYPNEQKDGAGHKAALDIKYSHDQLVYDILNSGVGVSTNPILVKTNEGTSRIPTSNY